MGKGQTGLPGLIERSVGIVEQVLCSTILTIMVVAIGLQVVFRYVINSPLDWTEEGARLGLVWLTFLGASMVMGRKAHIVIDIIVLLLPARVRLAWGALIDLSIGALLALLVVAGWKLVVMSQGVQTAIGLPVGLFYLALPVASVLMMFRVVLLISDSIGELLSPREARAGREGQSTE